MRIATGDWKRPGAAVWKILRRPREHQCHTRVNYLCSVFDIDIETKSGR